MMMMMICLFELFELIIIYFSILKCILFFLILSFINTMKQQCCVWIRYLLLIGGTQAAVESAALFPSVPHSERFPLAEHSLLQEVDAETPDGLSESRGQETVNEVSHITHTLQRQ